MNTSIGEECGAKVKDEVDTSELLPGLDKNAGEYTEADPIVRSAETIKVGALPNCFLMFHVEANLLELCNDHGIVRGQ